MNSLAVLLLNKVVAKKGLLVSQSLRGMMKLNQTSLATRRALKSLVYQPRYSFSGQQLNENEVIELVEGKIFEVLKSAAKCNHAKLSRTATFEELGFDSLDGVELVLAMEEHFGFDLSNQDAEKITSVMDAI